MCGADLMCPLHDPPQRIKDFRMRHLQSRMGPGGLGMHGVADVAN